jgi:predicted AAA+ superfamily ATPase
VGETTTNNDLLKKIAETVTGPHHHIIVTYEEDSDIEVDGVAISAVPLVDFLLTT